MKSLLARLSPHKAIGLYIGDREVVLSQVASTPLGPVEIARQSAPYQADQLHEVVGSLLKPLLVKRRRRRMPVALGLPTMRVFFSTRPIRTTNKDASPQVLLHEVLHSPAISIDDMAVDLISAQPDRRKVASIVACRKKYLNGLLATLRDFPVRLVRTEPAPCALLRVATQEYPTRRRTKTVLRIFLGASQGLAVVTSANLPIIWRSFDLSAGDEGNTFRAIVRSLQTLLGHCGVEGKVDGLLIHGRPDLHAQLGSEESSCDLGMSLQCHPGPVLEESTIAGGLALGCLNPVTESFDLARSLKPRPSLLDLFPWGELAIQVALLVCMGLFLNFRSDELQDQYATVQAESKQNKTLTTTSEAQLRKEKKELEQKVEAIRGYLTTRVLWTTYTHDIASRLPANTSLHSLQGFCELSAGGAKKKGPAVQTKKTFVIKALVPITQNGTMPREIDAFLGSLRGHPLLKKDFPLVELADIRWLQSAAKEKPLASFTVVCLPTSDKNSKGPANKSSSAAGGR